MLITNAPFNGGHLRVITEAELTIGKDLHDISHLKYWLEISIFPMSLQLAY